MKPIAKGYVLSVGSKSFWCRLKMCDTQDEVEAQVAIAKLPERERRLLTVGAYLQLLKGGTWRFLRLKPWTQREIREAKQRARETARALGFAT